MLSVVSGILKKVAWMMWAWIGPRVARPKLLASAALSTVMVLGACAYVALPGKAPQPAAPQLSGAQGGHCPRIGPIYTSFEPDKPVCTIAQPVRMTSGPVTLANTATLDCATAQAYDAFIRNVAKPAAQQIFGQSLTKIHSGPGYVCRNQYHRRHGPLSFHAVGKAIDIHAFELADGTTISLTKDWGKPTAKGAYLRQVRDGGCRHFPTVYGPEYNRAHRDHFHFEIDGYPTCR